MKYRRPELNIEHCGKWLSAISQISSTGQSRQMSTELETGFRISFLASTRRCNCDFLWQILSQERLVSAAFVIQCILYNLDVYIVATVIVESFRKHLNISSSLRLPNAGRCVVLYFTHGVRLNVGSGDCGNLAFTRLHSFAVILERECLKTNRLRNPKKKPCKLSRNM